MPCKHTCLYYFLNDLNYFIRKCRKNEGANTSKNTPVRISVPKIYVSQPSSVKKGVVRTNNRYVAYFTALIMHHVMAYKRCDFFKQFFISAFFLCRISCKRQFLFSFLLLSNARCVRLHFVTVVFNLFWKIYSLYVFTTIWKYIDILQLYIFHIMHLLIRAGILRRFVPIPRQPDSLLGAA